jgi:hypothetical protein
VVSAQIQHALFEGGGGSDAGQEGTARLLSPRVHLRYISALTCQYSFCRRDVALRSTIREGPLGRATHGPDVPRRFHPGPAVVGPTRRHYGADRP